LRIKPLTTLLSYVFPGKAGVNPYREGAESGPGGPFGALARDGRNFLPPGFWEKGS